MQRSEGEPRDDAPNDNGSGRDPPVPPGLLLRQKYFDRSGVREADLARQIGISRTTLSQVFNIGRPVTARTATKFWKAFGEDPAELLDRQERYDAWRGQRRRPAGKGPKDRVAPPGRRPPPAKRGKP